ncbi:MAG: ATP-binding cassette domain-containing protein [Chloroflexi bacterium]|nr:ATP-binding cassette domain-containing protein [Chloroflexota bacterium]
MAGEKIVQHPPMRAKDRPLLAPEFVQTSAMDCGPAALMCLLKGFGVAADYARLREACQTGVDGTSIDTLEDVARQLGLRVDQLLAPLDHLFLPEAALLPALVVTVLPTGAPHFVVVWRVQGPYVQIMDPAAGRRWLTRQKFMQSLYHHQPVVSALAWREWAGTDGFCNPLRARLRSVGGAPAQVERLVESALALPEWRPLALLDAATRLVTTLVESQSLRRGPAAFRLVTELLEQRQPGAEEETLIPAALWSVRPSPPETGDTLSELLTVTGAVVMVVRGRLAVAESGEHQVEPPPNTSGQNRPHQAGLESVLSPPTQPLRAVLQALRADGWLVPSLVLPAALLAAGSVTLEAALFRGLMGLTETTGFGAQPLLLAVGVLFFGGVLWLLEGTLGALVRRLGRRLETRLRIALLTKIPQLGDRYFHSRLIADMAHRAYSLYQLHSLPGLGVRLVQLGCQLLLTSAGVVWLAPESRWAVLTLLLCVCGAAFLSRPLLGERDLRVRTHVGALSRFYLDALLGLLPVRAHSAERSLRREHEMLLVRWARALSEQTGIELILRAAVALAGIGGACWIVLTYLAGGGEASGVLLLLYWALNLPVLSQELVSNTQRYLTSRNHLSRVLEPLSTPVEEPQAVHPPPVSSAAPALTFQQVTVVASGQTLLRQVELTVAPGEHVAIVGASGAGKSSLVGLLLGWQQPASGQLLVDGVPLIGPHLASLRRRTAWVDPAVQLWNRSLVANLRYGESARPDLPLEPVLAQADLFDLLRALPDGLATRLGEGGALVSGGEGQRVRLGRALFRSGIRLAILDEPFRGLDRRQRRQLLAVARHHWETATLLYVTHDISETQEFARVLVLEGGQVVEDGPPQKLLSESNSHYRRLWQADAATQQHLWGERHWRQLHMADGQLTE